jgi:acyl carrier protein
MTRNEIFEKLKDIIKRALPDRAEFIDACDETVDLHTGVGLNSIGLLYVVIAIEESFNVSFDEVSFNDFNTVGDVIDFIEQQD